MCISHDICTQSAVASLADSPAELVTLTGQPGLVESLAETCFTLQNAHCLGHTLLQQRVKQSRPFQAVHRYITVWLGQPEY